MRIRLLIGTFALAVLAVLVMPGVAQAKPKGTAEQDCINKLQNGGAIDDCQKAPSPILPEGNEIIWGGAAFVVLLVIMWKVALPPVRNMVKAREDRIRGDLERAEQARTEAESELEQYRTQLAGARSEAARIIEEARESADGVKRQIQSQAEADAAETRTRAQEDVRLAAERATADLQGRVADLSIELAEKIVERNLDHDTQIQLIENYINQVGSR